MVRFLFAGLGFLVICLPLAGCAATGPETQETIPAGSLLLPDDGKGTGAGEEKQRCMTVCARWGEDCTYVNRGAGGTTRECRRACKQYTEECF